jgi:murein DD-endopeptidase MepM/ murein hydrolase activator NlpD
VARVETAALKARREELTALEADLAQLRAAADAKRAAQEDALNASLAAAGDVKNKIAENERAAQAAAELAAQLARQASAQAAAIEEARRRAAAEAAAAAAAAAANATSSYGFRWPERSFNVTQEWGPTTFQLEPPYTYQGTYYPHFHAGIDFANGCGTRIYSAGAGVVVASGQPLMPWDSGFGVVVDHGNGIQTWYWHMQPNVVVSPGTIVTSNSIIGYEGTTGMSTGCHVHFAVNHHGVWENPRRYLP